jgi:hypothetical protein
LNKDEKVKLVTQTQKSHPDARKNQQLFYGWKSSLPCNASSMLIGTSATWQAAHIPRRKIKDEKEIFFMFTLSSFL